jgi:hypothetical protein
MAWVEIKTSRNSAGNGGSEASWLCTGKSPGAAATETNHGIVAMEAAFMTGVLGLEQDSVLAYSA